MVENIFITVAGGLGDQVCAEPVIREIKRIWPDKRIAVVGRPEFFGHLGIEIFNYEGGSTIVSGEAITLNTFAAEAFGILTHPIDFISIGTIKRTLPNYRKEIFLKVKGEPLLKDHLLIHAGKSWENKTFPHEWWQEVVNLCSSFRKCALIGGSVVDVNRDGSKLVKGVLDIDCPHECVDLRGKTTIDELISLISANDVLSNDSFPVHVAGAFDNWIYMIPTAKHPDLLLPWRKGSQYYKTCCPVRKMMSDEVSDNFLPAASGKFSLRIDLVPEGKDILDYIPSPQQVFEAVTKNLPRDGSITWFD
jgi:ADP-heptose:LPS heptosyltransferase